MGEIKIEETKFGQLSNGQEVKRYVLKNKNGLELALISYGAAIQSVKVKDRNENLVSVALGFNTLEEYTDMALNPSFGSTIGRVSNRISNAKFTLNGETYNLEKNNGKHCLHSGNSRTTHQNWSSSVIDNGVKFTYTSPDGEGGFPGNVKFETIYRLENDSDRIIMETKAITDKATPVNIAKHCYFNLAGENTDKKIYDQIIRLNCDRYLDFDKEESTVTGKINSVEGTKYDFRDYEKLGDRIKVDGRWPEEGFDNFLIVTDKSEFRNVATIKNLFNGLRLDIDSNQNGLHFYTACHLDLKKPSTGQVYSIHHGISLDAMNFPDSVNHPSFPSCILNPGEEYFHKEIFSFSVEQRC